LSYERQIKFKMAATASLQNFIYLRQSVAEILLFVQKSKMVAAAILDLFFSFLIYLHVGPTEQYTCQCLCKYVQ